MAASRTTCLLYTSAYISQVLHSPVYAGHIIYEAKPTVSMKSKKRRYIPFDERAIVPNTHEAIIPQAVSYTHLDVYKRQAYTNACKVVFSTLKSFSTSVLRA